MNRRILQAACAALGAGAVLGFSAGCEAVKVVAEGVAAVGRPRRSRSPARRSAARWSS
jgi:hypothetical protein